MAEAAAPVVEVEVDTAAAPLAAPGAAPLAAPAIQVEDEEVPLAVMDIEDDIEDEITDDQELFEVENEEVPLANTGIIENVHHCITHFIELIIAGVLSLYYVGSTKKEKKEITGLKKDIDDKERR